MYIPLRYPQAPPRHSKTRGIDSSRCVLLVLKNLAKKIALDKKLERLKRMITPVRPIKINCYIYIYIKKPKNTSARRAEIQKIFDLFFEYFNYKYH